MPYAMRKIRGKDLYKVWNTQSGEIKSSGSTKKDAQAQIRLLRGLEKKEAGSLKADQIKDVIDFSYEKGKGKVPDGYEIDKELSDDRVKVYKDLNSKQVIIAHRGSKGWSDWLDNAFYAKTGNIKSSNTYKTHKTKHEKALKKYGAENVISVGHSRAGKYVEELNKEKPVKEVITYNKAVGFHDAFQKNPSNQTDIRTSRDLVSALTPLQRSSNKVVTIPSHTLNPFKAHGTSSLSSLGNKLLGKGLKGGGNRFNPKSMRVGEMRKFIKSYKKAKYGEKWVGGAKYGKKQLVEMIKPMLEDDDIDELVGGSVWTDFVKDFSSKHGLKYACSLSKYKEQLKKAYKLFKEKKDWFEPMKIDAISQAVSKPNIKMVVSKPKEPSPEPNITFTIEEPSTPKTLPPLISEREMFLIQSSIPVLKDILKKAGIKGITKMKKDDMIKAILQHENIAEGVKWGTKPYVYDSLKEAHVCLDDSDVSGLRATKYALQKTKEKIQAGVKGTMRGDVYRVIQNDLKSDLKRYEARIAKCEELLKRDFQKEFEGSGILSGGNRWTDFVKDYAKSYNTTYGCALSDIGIKSAYKLFKDGKTWYFPKVSATIETQTDDFIEPEPEKAPENIDPVINRIEEKIVKLEKIGSETGAVSYNSTTFIVDIAFINLLNKYGGKCIVSNIMNDKIDIGIDINVNPNKTLFFTGNKYNQYTFKLANILQDCIRRGIKLIAIPLGLKFGENQTGHANMLIYRPFKRLVERFEPHGQAYGNSIADDRSFNNQLRKLWEQELSSFIGPVRYREPVEICPIPKGFQSLEGSLKGLKQEGGGFCSMWSLFLAEMTFINPDKSTKEIIEEVLDITKKDPKYLKALIRGYVVEVEKGLDDLLKIMGKKGFTFKGVGVNSPFQQVFSSADDLRKWLLDLVFDTGKYSEAPPQYEPLPDVIIKEKSDVEKLKELYTEKLSVLTKAQLEKIFSIFRRVPKTGNKKDDLIMIIVDALHSGKWAKSGSTGLADIDVILEEELYKPIGNVGKGLPIDYFIKKRDEREKK